MTFLKRFFFFIAVVFLGSWVNHVQAQSDARTHFIYIQSEGQQAFYAILNKKSYSSSSVGYLIISKLTDGDYNLTIGFPQDVFPAQTYKLKVKSTDAGYRLQKVGSDKWELVDKVSQNALAIVNTDNSDNSVSANTSDNNQKNNAGFGALLSKTSNDTTNYQAYAAPTANKDNKAVEKNSDNTSIPTETTAATNSNKKTRTKNSTDIEATSKENKESFANESYDAAAARSATQSVVKTSERSDRRGVSMTFVLTTGDKIDTVNTFFPGDSKNSSLEEDNESSTTNTSTAATSSNVSPEKVALKNEVDSRKGTNNPFYKGDAQNNKNNNSNLGLFTDDDSPKSQPKSDNKSKDVNEASNTKTTATKEIFNSTCTNMVTDKDMEKIRKKMIAKTSDDEMIAVARKYIDTKCVYTAQIKELGGLLISDNGRFALYRILYPNVYDGQQFPTLKDQLLDKNYKAQFDSLIQNR